MAWRRLPLGYGFFGGLRTPFPQLPFEISEVYVDVIGPWRVQFYSSGWCGKKHSDQNFCMPSLLRKPNKHLTSTCCGNGVNGFGSRIANHLPIVGWSMLIQMEVSNPWGYLQNPFFLAQNRFKTIINLPFLGTPPTFWKPRNKQICGSNCPAPFEGPPNIWRTWGPSLRLLGNSDRRLLGIPVRLVFFLGGMGLIEIFLVSYV